MFGWLKRLFTAPVPAGPPVLLAHFDASNPTITRDVILADGEGWAVDAVRGQTIHLFEVDNPGVEQCVLTYRAQLKSQELTGRAYLEMWCRLPGQGEFFSKGFHNALKGTHDWVSCEIPFYLKQGQMPDLVKLDITTEGQGKVWVRNIELYSTPTKGSD